MGTWALATRPDVIAPPQLGYPASEVDAWVEAVGASEAGRRARLASTARRVARAEAQIRLAGAAKDAIVASADRAAAREGTTHHPQCERVLREAQAGALAVLASACRRIADLCSAELCSAATESPCEPDPSVPTPPGPEVSAGADLQMQRAYLADEAERHMDAVRSSGIRLRSELDDAVARAEEVEQRLFDVGDAIPVNPPGGTAGGAEIPAAAEDGLLAAARRDAFEILDVARRAIAEMYGQAEADLLGTTGTSSVGEQQQA